jgi:hypothetical protein
VVKALAGDSAPPPIIPKRGQKHDVMAGKEITIAVEIGVKANDSAVGYEYVTVAHGRDPFTVSDPLADIRGAIPLVAARAPALALIAPAAATGEAVEATPQAAEAEQSPHTQEASSAEETPHEGRRSFGRGRR